MSRNRTERGATSVEYGLIAFLMAGCLVVAVGVLGDANKASFQDSCQKIASAAGDTC